jgi:hypothetical protein
MGCSSTFFSLWKEALASAMDFLTFATFSLLPSLTVFCNWKGVERDRKEEKEGEVVREGKSGGKNTKRRKEGGKWQFEKEERVRKRIKEEMECLEALKGRYVKGRK